MTYNEEENDSLDFSQYIPKWKSEDDDEDDSGDKDTLSYHEGMFDDLEPETIITELNGFTVRVKHVHKAVLTLRKDSGSDGPFAFEEIDRQVENIIIEEAIHSLIEKGLLTMNGNMLSLTPKGREVAEELSKNNNTRE